MNGILSWGIEFIKNVQSILPDWFITFTQYFTHLGGMAFYVIVITILMWCVDEKKGFKIVWILVFSTCVNGTIKNLLKVQRPYIYEPSVGYGNESSYSTPSGHSQMSATFWGIFGTTFCEKLKKIFQILIMLLPPFFIGFSRIILGVHYPTDVLFGWAIGVVFVLASVFLWDKIALKFNKLHLGIKCLIIFLISYLLNLIDIRNVTMSAILFGMSIGYILMKEQGGFDAKSGTLWKKILRYVLGIGIVVLLNFAFKAIVPSKGHDLYQIFRFVRYMLVGFFLTFVNPKLFVITKLADSKNKTEEISEETNA